jgi:hypothetical protein
MDTRKSTAQGIRRSPPRRQMPTGGSTNGIHAVVSATLLSRDVAYLRAERVSRVRTDVTSETRGTKGRLRDIRLCFYAKMGLGHCLLMHLLKASGHVLLRVLHV